MDHKVVIILLMLNFNIALTWAQQPKVDGNREEKKLTPFADKILKQMETHAKDIDKLIGSAGLKPDQMFKNLFPTMSRFNLSQIKACYDMKLGGEEYNMFENTMMSTVRKFYQTFTKNFELTKFPTKITYLFTSMRSIGKHTMDCVLNTTGYQLGLTHLSDWSDDEYKSLLGERITDQAIDDYERRGEGNDDNINNDSYDNNNNNGNDRNRNQSQNNQGNRQSPININEDKTIKIVPDSDRDNNRRPDDNRHPIRNPNNNNNRDRDISSDRIRDPLDNIRGGSQNNRDRESSDRNRDRDSIDRNRDRDSLDRNRDRDSIDRNRDRDSIDRNRDPDSLDRNRDRDSIDRNRDPDSLDRNRDRDSIDRNRDRDSLDRNRDRDSIERNRDRDSLDRNRDRDSLDRNRDRNSLNNNRRPESNLNPLNNLNPNRGISNNNPRQQSNLNPLNNLNRNNDNFEDRSPSNVRNDLNDRNRVINDNVRPQSQNLNRREDIRDNRNRDLSSNIRNDFNDANRGQQSNLNRQINSDIIRKKRARTKSKGVPEICKAKNRGQLPNKLDWRERGKVTPAKYQGSCGSCWSFTSLAVLESAYLIKGKTGDRNFDLSEQEVLSCARKDGCKGGTGVDAYNYLLKKRGVSEESNWPYEEKEGKCTGGKKKKEKKVAVIKDYCLRGKYAQVNGRPEELSDEEIMYTIREFGPVYTTINADDLSMKNLKTGIYDNKRCPKQTNHAVTLVGWDEHAWIIKNSWGTEWGDDGFFRMKRGENLCGINTYIMFPIV